MLAITGAAGFIGANLAARLLAEGRDVLLVDHARPAANGHADLAAARFELASTFPARLATGRLRPQAIFHLGACSSTTENDWGYLSRNNIEYTKQLWKWCALADRPLVYASSAATYGDGSKGFSDHLSPDELAPLNPYGRSKNDFDRWALAEVAAKRAVPPRWYGLKFFNVYGPRESHKGRMASVVWHAYKQIRETGRMRLFRSNDPAIPDGGQRRDFVSVEDCVEQMLWMPVAGPPSGLYNCGTGRARSFLELTKAVFAALDMPERVDFIPMPADLGRQYQNYTQAETAKLRAAGYDRPATELEAGVARTVAAIAAQGWPASAAA